MAGKLPWRFAHAKNIVGYRRFEVLKDVVEARKTRSPLCDRQILFIHIPKTAGVSLIEAYSDFFVEARHSTALYYRTRLGHGFNGLDSVAVVRNPWARLLSAYNFLISGGMIRSDEEMGNILRVECPTFEGFVKDWLPKKGVCSYMHFVPQHEFVCGWNERIIVEHILHMENLNKEWKDLAENLGIPDKPIGTANVGKIADYKTRYDEESSLVVSRLYRKDIKMFGYEF
jgi:chondroitin 4-sulfotransferase 11